MSISTCALREEGDLYIEAEKAGTEAFLSTPSARRATGHDRQEQAADGISIHALREEGDTRSRWSSGIRPISIHALREEGDFIFSAKEREGIIFLSTPSARRATRFRPPSTHSTMISIHALREEGDVADVVRKYKHLISIHALREEGDSMPDTIKARNTYFYPRPPRGGRQPAVDVVRGWQKFLSTPSARRATAKTETKSLFSNKLYNILHEFRRALIYNGSKNYPNHAK